MEILPGALARHVRPDIAAGKLQRQRRLTGSEVDSLVELYATGINVRQLAAAFGINPATLRRELTEVGIQLRPPGRPLAQDDRRRNRRSAATIRSR